MASTRHRLSHEDIWQVMNTSDEVSDTELANALGSTPSAIHNLRWKLRNQPWACRISWDPCPQYGEPLIRQHGRQLYHTACRPQVLQRLNASYEPDRERVSPSNKLKPELIVEMSIWSATRLEQRCELMPLASGGAKKTTPIYMNNRRSGECQI